MVQMNMTYYAFLVKYRDTVNHKVPNKAFNNTGTSQIVQQTNTGCDGGWKNGRGRRGGRGKRGSSGCVGWGDNWRDYKCQVIGIDSTIIKVHLTYQFEHEQWFHIPANVPNQINQMWHEYQCNKRQRTSVSTYNHISHLTGGNYLLPPPTDIPVTPTIPPLPPP